MSSPQSVAIELVNITKTFGAQTALSDLSLSVEPGELVALLGPSGCGKTTALRSIAGLESIDSGTILIDGEDVTDRPTNKRDMGMVFQSYSLFPHLTAGENVEFGLRMRKVGAVARRRKAAQALALVGLDNHVDRYAHELSGGQQQRVALARALVTEPRVLLLDEPLSALDAKVRVQLRDEIRRIQTQLGITTFFVTHDQEEALAIADRVAVMQNGNIDQIGSPEDLYQHPQTPFVAEFIGLSNSVEGVVSAGKVEVLGHTLPLLHPETASGPARALIRPEDVELASAGMPGTVISSSFLGSMRRTNVLLPDGKTIIAVQHAVRDTPQPGANVFLKLSGAAVSVVPL